MGSLDPDVEIKGSIEAIFGRFSSMGWKAGPRSYEESCPLRERRVKRDRMVSRFTPEDQNSQSF